MAATRQKILSLFSMKSTQTVDDYRIISYLNQLKVKENAAFNYRNHSRDFNLEVN